MRYSTQERRLNYVWWLIWGTLTQGCWVNLRGILVDPAWCPGDEDAWPWSWPRGGEGKETSLARRSPCCPGPSPPFWSEYRVWWFPPRPAPSSRASRRPQASLRELAEKTSLGFKKFTRACQGKRKHTRQRHLLMQVRARRFARIRTDTHGRATARAWREQVVSTAPRVVPPHGSPKTSTLLF